MKKNIEPKNKIKTYIRYSPEQIDQIIKQWQESDQTKRSFCEQNQISYYRFGNWTTKRGLKRKGNSKERNASSSFIPITLSSSRSSVLSSPTVEISYPDGRKISFYYQPDTHLLQTLLA
jgi:hypothetical protein